MACSQALFSSSLISPEVVATLDESYTLRSLERGDFAKGYLDCLRVLSHVGDLTVEQFEERFDEMYAINTHGKPTYFLIVLEHKNRIVGNASLVVERKFIHNRGVCGHIEEVSIAKDQQGKKFGLKMLQAVDSVAQNVGCYKSILDCSPENEPFYIKCGYKSSGTEMSHYYEEEKDAYHRG